MTLTEVLAPFCSGEARRAIPIDLFRTLPFEASPSVSPAAVAAEVTRLDANPSFVEVRAVRVGEALVADAYAIRVEALKKTTAVKYIYLTVP